MLVRRFFSQFFTDYAKYVSNAAVYEGFFHSFLRIMQSTFPMLLCSVQVQSDCSCAQST